MLAHSGMVGERMQQNLLAMLEYIRDGVDRVRLGMCFEEADESLFADGGEEGLPLPVFEFLQAFFADFLPELLYILTDRFKHYIPSSSPA